MFTPIFVWPGSCARPAEQTKNDRDLNVGTFNTPHSVSKSKSVNISAKVTLGSLALENCRVTWISAFLLDCLVLVVIGRF